MSLPTAKPREFYDEISGTYVHSQEEADKKLESFFMASMKQGEREEYKRQRHIDRMRALGVRIVSVPNPRSEGQKKRWAKVREQKRVTKLNDTLALELAKGWKVKYNRGGNV